MIKQRKIDGSGIFILIKDENDIYTILFMNHKKSGIKLEDPGGICEQGYDTKINATKELYEESCGTIRIEPHYLLQKNSILISKRYLSYIVGLKIKGTSWKDLISTVFAQNRSMIFDQRQKYFSYLETTKMVVIEFEKVVKEISTQSQLKKTADIIINYEGEKCQLHNRTKTLIQEMISKNQDDIYFQDCTFINQKYIPNSPTCFNGRLCMIPIKNHIKQEPVQKIDGSGILIIFFDKNQPYVVLFVEDQFICEPGGQTIDDDIKINAIKQTYSKSCALFELDMSILQEDQSIILNSKFKSYIIALQLNETLKMMQCQYINNRDILIYHQNLNKTQQNVETSQILVISLSEVKKLFDQKTLYLDLQGSKIPFHERTVALFQQLFQRKIQNIEKNSQFNIIQQKKQYPQLDLQKQQEIVSINQLKYELDIRTFQIQRIEKLDY